MSKRLIAALFVALLVLAGCGSSAGDKTDAPIDKNTGVDGEKSKSQDEEQAASSCDGYTGGQDGVIRTFCDGSAEVKFDIGGNEGSIGGGECATSGGYFSVNAGVVVGSDFSGTKPDYAGFNLPEADGDFSSSDGNPIVASITSDGEVTVIQDVSGTHDADGGSFEGTAMEGGGKVSVTFTC